MELSNILHVFSYSKKKKEAADIVISAETLAHETGLNAIDILKQYQGSNFFIQEILTLYNQNKPKHIIYKKIFDSNFLSLLKACESKGLLLGEIFRDYMEIQTQINVAKGKVTSCVIQPVMTYLIGSLIIYFVLTKINAEIATMKILKVSAITTVLSWFWFVILGVAFAILIPVFKFPRKTPVIAKVYKELDGFQFLSSIYLILKSGLSMVDVYEMNQEKFVNIPYKATEAVLEYLKKFLSITELYAVKIAVQTFKYEVIFKSLLNGRRATFDTNISKATGAVSTLLTFLIVIPVGMMLYAMFSMYSAISQLSKGG